MYQEVTQSAGDSAKEIWLWLGEVRTSTLSKSLLVCMLYPPSCLPTPLVIRRDGHYRGRLHCSVLNEKKCPTPWCLIALAVACTFLLWTSMTSMLSVPNGDMHLTQYLCSQWHCSKLFITCMCVCVFVCACVRVCVCLCAVWESVANEQKTSYCSSTNSTCWLVLSWSGVKLHIPANYLPKVSSALNFE